MPPGEDALDGATRHTGDVTEHAAPAIPAPHRAPQWVHDVLAPLVVLLPSLVPMPDGDLASPGPAITALMMTPAVIVTLRHRWPHAVLAANTAVYCAVLLLGTVSPGGVLAMMIAMFAVARTSSRRTTLIVVGVTVGAVVGLSLAVAAMDTVDPRTFQVAVTIALAAAAGEGSRSRNAYFEAVNDRILRAEQTREAETRRRVSEERLRIARDLHDAVAHQIAVISLNAGVATSALDTDTEKTRAALATVRSASRTVLSEIGDLMGVLRTNPDEDEPLSPTGPQPTLAELDGLLDSFRALGLTVDLRREGIIDDLPVTVDIVAYRVIHEGLTNAHKHGGGRRAAVLVEAAADTLTVVVTNPMGAAVTSEAPHSGFGLVGLNERVASVRGTLSSGIAPGGFRLAATLPLRPQEDM